MKNNSGNGRQCYRITNVFHWQELRWNVTQCPKYNRLVPGVKGEFWLSSIVPELCSHHR